jgi:GDP-L-fucose synthase
MKKVLVTGATGFLGKALAKSLSESGRQITPVSSKTCDLTVAGSLDQQFKNEKFDEIYHLAAWTQAGDFCLTHQGEQWVINQRINTNVLGWWHERQPQAKMIAIGTSCSYAPDLPLKEENYLKGEPIDGLFTYAMTKRMMYTGLRSFAKQFGHKYLHVVPSTLYGPGYHTDGRQMHFIFDLIRKIIRGKRHGETVTLWGDGHQKRELVHVDDFARIMHKLNDTQENEIFNIGYGREYSIREFAQMICDVVGYDFAKIQFDTSKYVGAKSKCLDVEKLRKTGLLENTIPLPTGLKNTIHWFEEAFK